jgi:Raf kinase inhibitor-like YbhB/YbcL family protein
MLPSAFECYQSNPEIQWEGVPEGTVALALIFDDPTAGNFPHWAIYNIPATETGLAAAISGDAVSSDLPDGAGELENGFQFDGYLGSCPCGSSPNTYRWRLWALDAELDAPGSGSSASQFSSLAGEAEDASIEMLEMSHQYGPATICP